MTASTSSPSRPWWQRDDPAGQGIESVRPIRDEIRGRVERLLAELLDNA